MVVSLSCGGHDRVFFSPPDSIGGGGVSLTGHVPNMAPKCATVGFGAGSKAVSIHAKR